MYVASGKSTDLRPGKSYTFHTFTSYCPATGKQDALAEHASLKVKDAEKYLSRNAERWEGYLSSILDRDTEEIGRAHV